MFELRILSGLHRGATLPLDDKPHLVGASEDADVVLVDDSIQPRHAMLSCTESGWAVYADGGDIFDANTNVRLPVIDLMVGDFARLGDIWIMIVRDDAPWVRHPPVPVDAPSLSEEGAELASATTEAPASIVETPASIDVSGMPGAVAPVVSADVAAPARRRHRVLAIPLLAMVVLSAAAAYALAPRSLQPEGTSKNVMKTGNGAKLQVNKSGKATISGINNTDASKSNLPLGATPELTSKQLAKAFEKQLADVDLLKRFDLTLEEDLWTMQGNLDDEETTLFERVLPKFLAQHHIKFPVNAKIVSVDNMLPFKIHQVISGLNASIVTQDGQRLYVGEEYRGVRVVSIQDNHLSFAGKRKIEMNW